MTTDTLLRSARALLATVLVLTGAVLALAPSADAQEDPRIEVLHLEGQLTSALASYVERAVVNAVDDGTELIILRLDTPGGRIDLSNEIVNSIQSSDVPVVVWVGPKGAMAGSAGTFITLAGHVAAMSPGTTIGAASPVDGTGGDLDSVMKAKTEEMLLAQVRILTKRRGGQAVAWAESAVTSSKAATAFEAKDLGVVDLIVTDLDDLLNELDGRPVLVDGEPHILQTSQLDVLDRPMDIAERGLHILTNPSLAFILLVLGLGGIVYEFANPGIGLSGVVGLLCLAMAVYAFDILPVDWLGVALIVAAFGMFVVDIKVGTGGLLGIAGVVTMVLGGTMLFSSPEVAVSGVVLWTTAIVVGGFFVFAGRAMLRAHQAKVTTGAEGLVNAVGRAKTELAPDGLVAIEGETWRATAESGAISAGESVQVSAVENLRLRVRPADTAVDTDTNE